MLALFFILGHYINRKKINGDVYIKEGSSKFILLCLCDETNK
jgi:hypothetical protein